MVDEFRFKICSFHERPAGTLDGICSAVLPFFMASLIRLRGPFYNVAKGGNKFQSSKRQPDLSPRQVLYMLSHKVSAQLN